MYDVATVRSLPVATWYLVPSTTRASRNFLTLKQEHMITIVAIIVRHRVLVLLSLLAPQL